MPEKAESSRRRAGGGAAQRRGLSPMTAVIAASALTIVLVCGLGGQVWESYRHHVTTGRQDLPVQALEDRIIHLDEVLTMSARMAAATGDPQWEERYRRFEPELDAAIRSLRERAPGVFDTQAAVQTGEANVELVAMENRVFELVRLNRLDEAQTILAGNEYQRQKKLYSQGMQRITDQLAQNVAAALAHYRQRALLAVVSVLIGLPLLVLIWLWVLRDMRRYLRQRDDAETARRRSEARFRSLVANIPGAVYRCQAPYPWALDQASEAVFEITGYRPEDLTKREFEGLGALILAQDVEKAKCVVTQAISAHSPFELKYRIRRPDGGVRWVHQTGRPVYDETGNPLWLVGVMLDVTKAEEVERELHRIEWLLTKRPQPLSARRESYVQKYGDLTDLNSSRLILDSVGKDMLADIAEDYMDMLETSCAVYEKNGDYALGIFASGWCSLLDTASRKLCGTADNASALKCGRWLCHESCWADASKVAIETGKPTEVECRGGIRLYAVPIYAGGEVVGAINCAHGDPCKDPDKLLELANRYHVDVDELRKSAEAYESRPAFIIDIAKERLQTSARLIGAIVERKMAQDRLFEAEEHYRNIFNSVNDAIVVLDAQTGQVLEANNRFCTLLDYTAQEAVNLCLTDISQGSPENSRAETVQLARLAANGAPQGFEWACRHRGGRLLPVEINLRSAMLRGHKCLLAVIRDISDRKRAEEEREWLMETLKRKNQELQSIVYMASHDLRSPLVNIRGFSDELEGACGRVDQLARDERVPGELRRELAAVLDEDIPESLSFIHAGIAKMESLLKGLLQISRLGTVALQIETIDMNEMLGLILKSMQFQITRSGADVFVDDLPGCIADKDQTNQVFTNILDNAVKYLDPHRKGVIRISGRVEGADAIYCIEDNGIGIAPEHLPRIFDLFHRLEPMGAVQGEGLGLTIARRIVERQGGSVRVESRAGAGSRFFVSLPRA